MRDANKLFYALVVWMFLTGLQCKKTDSNGNPISPPVLPPATQVGANTFGCKVNGTIYTPRDEPSLVFAPEPLECKYGSGILYIAANDVPDKKGVHIDIRNVFSVGTYPLSFPYFVSYADSTYDYETDSLHLGSLSITR